MYVVQRFNRTNLVRRACVVSIVSICIGTMACICICCHPAIPNHHRLVVGWPLKPFSVFHIVHLDSNSTDSSSIVSMDRMQHVYDECDFRLLRTVRWSGRHRVLHMDELEQLCVHHPEVNGSKWSIPTSTPPPTATIYCGNSIRKKKTNKKSIWKINREILAENWTKKNLNSGQWCLPWMPFPICYPFTPDTRDGKLISFL